MCVCVSDHSNTDQYMLMIDADTVVDPLSLNYLVGSFVQDKKGACRDGQY
jgi:cellulose synthase/poly-beta-1,6-N-acetylglucosamine synthase-like glycosyltransferase